MWHFLTHLFGTDGFPPRWECGTVWQDEPGVGWLHIVADLAIWGAYAAIPVVLLFFAVRRSDLPFSWLFVLFGAFILLCGSSHLLDAVMFYYPAYRLLGLAKLFTAVVSWATVFAVIQVLPPALHLPGRARLAESLADEVARRQASERRATEQEGFIRDVLDSMSNQAAVVDGDGKIRLVNRAWQQFFPFDPPDGLDTFGGEASRLTSRSSSLAVASSPSSERSLAPRAATPANGHATVGRSVAEDGRGGGPRSGPSGAAIAEPAVAAGEPPGSVHYLAALEGRVSPEQIMDAEVGLDRVLSGRAPSASWEFVVLADDLRCYLAHAAPMPHGGAVISHTDVTQQKRLEGELKMSRLEAESASRAKSEFLANMSHEIRTPMAAILSSADVLYPLLTESGQRDLLQILRDQGQILLAIINDILDLSKIESGRMEMQPEPVNILRLVTDLRSLMTVQAENRGIDLVAEFPTSFPRSIQTDPLRLRQILLNLLSNAIKFTHEGHVTLRVSVVTSGDEERSDLDSWTEDDPALGGGQVRFEVIDTGVGIPPDRLSDIFDPFTQVHAQTVSQSGTGLGLTICRRLARMLGGVIAVESVVGKGTTFTLTLPLKGAELDDLVPLGQLGSLLEEPREMPPPTDLEGLHVLVAEDTRGLRFLIERLLVGASASVTLVENGQEAIDRICGTNDPPFDVVLMDMQMPVLDGFEATRRLRSLGINVPVIALTAGAMSGDRERCLEAGCSDYLTKPFRREDIVATIHRLLSGAGDASWG